MNEPRAGWLAVLPRWGLVQQCATLALVTLVLYLLVASIGHIIEGRQAWLAAATAALLCLVGAELALISARLACHWAPQAMLFGFLMSMGVRLAIPLTGSLCIRLASPRMLEAGALYFMILFYLPILAVEIGLELGQTRPARLSTQKT